MKSAPRFSESQVGQALDFISMKLRVSNTRSPLTQISAKISGMIAKTPTTTMDQAWQTAIAQAESLSLPDYIWDRPQVQGFTIDGPVSRDLDDAIWIEKIEDGAIASIHIADVAEIIRVGSAVDKVALARTQTNYYGWGNEPMIPHSLSEGLLSLLEGQQRPTLTVKITLNDNAEIVDTEIFESWLASKRKLSYERADIIAKSPKAKFYHMFKLYQTWAEKLAEQREAMGAFGGLLSKTGILFDENGNVIAQDKFFHSQMIIQEFMILANRAVAQWFADRDILALYRNHTARAIAPEREELMNALLITGNTDLIRQKLQNWLNKAIYEPTLTGHFALNLPAYCHFTSPIRRLPDLINHRIIKAKIHGKRHPYKRVELEQLCKYIGTVIQILEHEKEDYHRERTQRQFSQQLLNPEALEALPEKEFTNVLKHSFRDQNFAPIRETAIARLNEERLVVQDLFLLLVQSGDEEIRRLVLDYLKRHIVDAPSIIAMGLNQEPTWDDFDYIAGSDSAPFIFWAEVTIAGLSYTTVHPAQESQKQRSRHLACLAWLTAFVNGELVAPEQRKKPKPLVVGAKTEATNLCEDASSLEPQPELHPSLTNHLKEGQNFVGLLLELFQGMKWDTPTFEDSEADDGFRCVCKAIAWNKSFESEAIAPKKKRAKQLAARDLLVQLQKVAKG